MEQRSYHERIRDFVRRWRIRYEWSPALRGLVLAVGVLLAVAVALWLVLRLRVVRVLAVPAVIGAILVVGWLLLGTLLTIPRFTTEGPVVRNGVAVIVACGKKQGIAGMDATMDHVPEPRTGGWWPEKQGECTVWYHRPPLLEQRSNRQERAANLSGSGEMLQTEGAELRESHESQFERLPVVEKLPADER